MEQERMVEALTQVQNNFYENITEQEITELLFLKYIKENTSSTVILGDFYDLTETWQKYLKNIFNS